MAIGRRPIELSGRGCGGNPRCFV